MLKNIFYNHDVPGPVKSNKFNILIHKIFSMFCHLNGRFRYMIRTCMREKHWNNIFRRQIVAIFVHYGFIVLMFHRRPGLGSLLN